MNSEEVDQKFAEWLTYEGDAIASQVHDTLKDTSHSLEMDNGNHAVWHESHLGMLLVLPFEHAMAFSAEAMTGDFENSPLHNYVFATITELIMRATAVMEESEEDPL